MSKRTIAALCCAIALCGLLAACKKNSGGWRPAPLTNAVVTVTDAEGRALTQADGTPVTAPAPKSYAVWTDTAHSSGQNAGAPAQNNTDVQEGPTGANDWNVFPSMNPSRPNDLYPPGDPALNGTTRRADFASFGRMAWPTERLPAEVPAAAAYIDRFNDRFALGKRARTVYVTEMPYLVFCRYVGNLQAAGFAKRASNIAAQQPSGESALYVGELKKDGQVITVTALWDPADVAGFEANFRLQVETAS
jgi:hypothetical protein